MATEQKCQKHNSQFIKICLADDCHNPFLLCATCDLNVHKHSKTQIQDLKNIKDKLKNKWEPKQSVINDYFKKTRNFYDDLRKQIGKCIDEDQKTVESILGKVKYHHLPIQANSQAYLELIKSDYDRLDKASIVKLINEAENGQLNKDLEKQKQVSQFLDGELKKISDKVLTLKYVLLSKKLQSEMLIPKLSEESKVANNDQFIKIYSLFNSRKMLIRSASLIYRGSQNEFMPSSFYNQCIGLQNCLAVVRTKQNKVFGGFSPVPLVHDDQDQLKDQEEYYQADTSKKSFIFSINNLKSYSLKDSQRAVRYRKNWPGPSFGVDLDMGKEVTSNLGHSYQSAPGAQVDSIQAKVFLLQTDRAQIKDIEIWQMSF